MKETFQNILLISGNGRNVGKTTFACQVISNLKNQQITAVKISPHFHEPTPGLQKISKGTGWIINEETNPTSKKDSSLYLQAGAVKSFYIQSEKTKLMEVFTRLLKFVPEHSPLIIESTGLSELISTVFKVKIIREVSYINLPPQKGRSLEIFSDGKTFNPGAELIIFDKGWKIKT